MWLRELRVPLDSRLTEYVLLESSHIFIHDWTSNFPSAIVFWRQNSHAEREAPICFQGNTDLEI